MLETPSPLDPNLSKQNGSAKQANSSQPTKERSISSSYAVIRRNGKQTPFDTSKISVAMTKAFLAVEGGQASASKRVHLLVDKLTLQVSQALLRRAPENGVLHIEDIQDQVELALMRSGEQKVARAYVLYRAEHEKQRRLSQAAMVEEVATPISILHPNGLLLPFDGVQLKAVLDEAVKGIEDVNSDLLYKMTNASLFEGMKIDDLNQVMVLSARSLIDKEPNYSRVAARLLLSNLRIEALLFVNKSGVGVRQADMQTIYPDYFSAYIARAAEIELLDEELTRFDLKKLGEAILPERDFAFNYLGLQTLYDRYFIHSEYSQDKQSNRKTIRIEMPQAFFMRVAMGLAINEIDRETKAIEFYQLLSSFDFMSSTPTLFNSGTLRPQLSSCYLTTVPDHLFGIYDSLRDNAMLSKFAGGLGNDWTRVRGMGANIKGTNGKSQGVVPFLKVANDTAVAVNQGGKRKGAVCAYLETWHIDVEDFLDLRKNTGDERRRCHDMNTANWIPDLFMQRVIEEAEWTLFSPQETPELHELTGKDFQRVYESYESKADSGELQIFKRVNAVDLWRKMLGMIFETGHPWITFKDPCNVRYTNQHLGVVHSSNLCTEITLHTSDDEIAVCNLGSINLAQHLNNGQLDYAKLEQSITTAMRMLDNVIDYNYYSVPQARHSNLKHRPVGLGLMGFQDALLLKGIPYASEAAVEFADQSMEMISYLAIKASCDLAKERGSYSTYQGSLWSQGILPIDSVGKMERERGNYFKQNQNFNLFGEQQLELPWQQLRESIQQYGMRNSNCLAIAPTATISNICGVSQSIEPTYQNIYVKSNLSGEFSVSNVYLIQALKDLNIWDEVMVNDLKYFDGSVQSIDRIPDSIKSIFATAFEIDSRWLIEAASRRQKWIDQAQSLNLYMAESSGKKLDQLYKLAWIKGLKTTYYLRSLGATQMEKAQSSQSEAQNHPIAPVKVCSILEPDCEACQ